MTKTKGIERLIVGQLQTNCYLVWDEKSRGAVIIDPGDDADFIIRKIQDLELKPELILVTHGHFDHVLAIPELKLAFQIPFLMHKKDLFLLKRSRETAKFFTGKEADSPLAPDKFIKENDFIKFGQRKLKTLENPGHSPGGVSFFSRGLLFSGDTLFNQGIGRTDYSYASEKELIDSIKNKLFKLPNETRVYPGHGEETTIGKEKGLKREAKAGGLRCSHCHEWISTNESIGTVHRNHCPYCLWSKHVDQETPGDRSSKCQAGMEPIGLTFKHEGWDKKGTLKQGEIMLIHQCAQCERVSINRVAGDDSPSEILTVLERSAGLEKGIKKRLEEEELRLLTEEDRSKIAEQLYGKANNL